MINLKRKVLSHIRNLPGWTTNRKIVVIESDDWGAIRMPSKETYDKLLKYGIKVDRDYFNRFDSLESNDDLEALFTILSKYKDRSGNHPVFTALSVLANPDFERIEKSSYNRYYCEPERITLERYGNSHSNVLKLREQGIKNKLYHPELHGREHLHVKRWMSGLQTSNLLRTCFQYRFCGLSGEDAGGIEYLAAFDLDNSCEIEGHKLILAEAMNLFSDTYRRKAQFFVAPNGLYNTGIENFLKDLGVRYMFGSRQQLEPIGAGKMKKNIRYTGKTNQHGQFFIVRNIQFEQGDVSGFNHLKALDDIATAFFWKKPAVISSHRVNYIGGISEENRAKGLKELDLLLKGILAKWPDVEFMSSSDLGKLIEESADK